MQISVLPTLWTHIVDFSPFIFMQALSSHVPVRGSETGCKASGKVCPVQAQGQDTIYHNSDSHWPQR